ncbi:hypothetical protein F4782DRAFT_539794 [Xylaria castorea]|nr:hypothetical protein F4782DRAFT_539794 [Xylaria castorea]
MAQPSSVLSQTMQSISLTKIRELEKQRGRYESRKNEVLTAVEKHPDNIRERITELLRGVKSLCEIELAQDIRVLNIDLWLQQSAYDTSIPFQMLQSYEALLRSKLEVQSRKLGIGHLWSRLVTEWMNSTTPISEAPDSDGSSEELDRQEKRLKELCEKFEEVVFTPLETDEARIEQYMQGLFSSDEAKKSLESLRSQIQRHEEVLFSRDEPFSREVLGWCINGLLAEDLLSDEKQAILREFLGSPVVLNEIADVLNMRFADFDNWSWEAGEQGIPVLPRPQLNGKYRIWMDEDVLQAIFIHYVGVKNCVGLKGALTRFLNRQDTSRHDGAWNWRAGEAMTNVDRVRFEYFSGTKLESKSGVDTTRSILFRESFFLSQLPASETTIGKNRAYVNDGNVEEDEEEGRNEKAPENFNVKQKLLRTLATESIVHRTLYGEAAVIQSDLQWYATGLSHTTIFAVMRFLGFSERIVSFYRKVLQAPLNMVSTPGESPTGEPRIRQRGVPMAHAPEKLTGEMILFIMDLAINKATGMLLYRLHDDLFLCGQTSRCAQAWKQMEEFADVMGVEFNKSKTGSVYLTNPEKSRDAEIEATLPEGVVRIGHLLLDQDSGEWVLDQDQIGEHVGQLRKQLAACNNILDWVKTWNSCISRFFSHTLGEPGYCFGLKHVDSVLETYQHIQRVLFKPADLPQDDKNQTTVEGSVVDYLKSKIKERFGVSDVPDAFIFLPEKMGVKNEKEEYDEARKVLGRLKSTEERLDRLRILYPESLWFEYARLVLDKVLVPGEDNDFMSFEEYTRHRESNSRVLAVAYNKLLEVPSQKGAKLEMFVTDALCRARIKDWENPIVLQIQWVLQLYQDELKERWGGARLVDERYLPLGLLAMMRRKAVKWTMLLPLIPISDHATTTVSSHKSSNQHVGASPSTNPFKLIPPAYRTILTTLHVLYPSTLLPALDLLDRRLVTRVILKQDATQQPTNIHDVTITSAQKSEVDGAILNMQEENKPLPLYHLVRSAQPQSHRRQHSASSGGRVYIVRLESWNCTCAAFAFSAFPPLPSPTPIFSSPAESSVAETGYQIFPGDSAMSSHEDAAQTWEFGGLSADGKDGAGGGVSCCKHLLACVLAEKWNAALGGYMEERIVGREEGAGLVGDL